ncbi:MAG TPA: dUTP diphosphatase [Armatimonadota bacterium]
MAAYETPLTEQTQATEVTIERLPEARDLPLPSYATDGSSGLDLRAAVVESLVLEPGRSAMVPAGIRIALPPGFEAQVRPRSGLAAKHGVTVLNAPGTIDSDYRGPVMVILINHGSQPFEIRRGERIAQMVLAPVRRLAWLETESLDPSDTARGEGGFGHTGRH